MERPEWQWSPSLRKYYYFDARTGDYVLQDGTRRPRVATDGRNTPRSHTQSVSGPPSSDLSNHDPRSAAAYSYASSGSQSSVPALQGSVRPDPLQLERRFQPLNNPSHGSQIEALAIPLSGVPEASRANLITDPGLLQAGVRAQRILSGTREAEHELLYPSFKVRKRDFFCFGRVFLVLWAEPAGESSSTIVSSSDTSDPGISTSIYNERVFSKVRRFVVIRERDTYCSALPIMTYGQRGVSKPGITKSEHAIIYTGRTPPAPSQVELPRNGEQIMRPIPIRVVPDNKSDALDPMSRLDFGKVHTVYHNIKVRSFGVVHPESMEALREQFVQVWMDSVSNGSAPRSQQKVGPSLAGGRPDQRSDRKARSPSPGGSTARARREAGYSNDTEDEDDDDEEDDDVDEYLLA